MRLRDHPYRFSLVLLATLGLLALDLCQRGATPLPPQPRAVLGKEHPPALHLQAQGHIPMPPNAAAAHASALLAMPKDSPAVLTAFWFAGDRESAPNVQIAAAQFDRASQRWSAPRYLVNRHAVGKELGFGLRRLGNPVAWIDAHKRIHLFVVATGLGGWSAGRILHLRQKGGNQALDALEFESLGVLPLSWLWNTSFLVRTAPLPLEDGGMLLPAYFELGIKYPVALRLDREGRYLGMQRLSRRGHLLQPALLPISPTRWLAPMRNKASEFRVAVAQTNDGGKTWNDLPNLPLHNPDSSIAALNLNSGQSLLVLNNTPQGRHLLDLYESRNGLEWQLAHPLRHGTPGQEFSYPAIAWADGSVWISYTDERQRIAWLRFGPEDGSKSR